MTGVIGAGAPEGAREPVRRLLWLAYFFPPLGGGGCQRTLKLVRYLDPLGWKSTVVTARDPDYWIVDPTLCDEIPASAEVLRVSAVTPHRLLRLLARAGVEQPQGSRQPGIFRALRRAQSWVAIPDGYTAWSRAAGRAAASRIEAGGVDALWTTSSPESAHVAGLALKRRFGLPWVADFRDPWVGRVTYAPPSRWHDRRHRALESEVVHGADRVTVVSEAMAALYRGRYPDLPAGRVVVLPNGVDAEDWRRADALQPASVDQDAARDRGRFVLLHAGQLAHRPTARTLLEGARRAIEEDPALARELRIRFLGGNEELPAGDPMVAALGDVVAIERSRPHLEAMAAMRRADALALLGHGGAADSLLYTGKIYEYATSGRPVLAVIDEGPAAALLRNRGDQGDQGDRGDPGGFRRGAVLASNDADGVASVLREWVAAWRRGERRHAGQPDPRTGSWERQDLAAQAARMLSEITSSHHVR